MTPDFSKDSVCANIMLESAIRLTLVKKVAYKWQRFQTMIFYNALVANTNHKMIIKKLAKFQGKRIVIALKQIFCQKD